MSNPFSEFERETLKLVKQDGTIVEELKTTGVAKGKVVFFREDVDFEEGDRLERPLPSGRIETYIIDDVQYSAKVDVIPGHYVLQVSNIAKPKIAPIPQNITYNLNGPNSRVNVHSRDQSHNVVGIEADDLFRQLEKVLQYSVSDQQHLSELQGTLTAMQHERGKPGFKDRYVEFMALASDHMTVLAPFLPALAQMLAQ